MSGSGNSGSTQYLTYKLADEIFGQDISTVREVLDYPALTKVPNMPDFMHGVINLRGSVVPVVDLRTKFRMPVAERTANSCIIITEVHLDGGTTVLGALADSVQEVLDLEPHQIEPAPKIGARLQTDFITGMGKRDDRFIILLDIDRLFSADEVQMAHAAGASVGPSSVVQQAA